MPTPQLFVFLSHGLESGPGSTKIQAMKDAAETFPNVTAIAIDHRSTKDPATRLTQMAAAMDEAGADPACTVLAGSSMGGWVCAQTSESQPVLGCFLLAPALAMAGYPQSSPRVRARFSQVIHGWADDVVPVMPVLELARKQGLPTLVLPDGHRLENSVDRVVSEFRWFLEMCRSNLNEP
ncbi:YqiA/YcfP family alpha/beta fold hydrolase [Marinobacter sp. M216]|uniref:YqiA/YcfP family alpha/beta fold hydrolase n=1 Tax=Marinobacter albus TaxID=3030833 RepID=A0ABT7HEB2_9GAMM|nr:MULTISPECIES: YqiA/YcfP family alpha/beta fold hydrolase [unclassified Marinobacter]MBW7472128.1 alpha/beta hydrolase [Marinobacter sp. F4218]MDK9558698.1 YqiA/YcfP family alpha/beta fold hydrolase [Marinobacter sp. M216]